MRERKLSSEKGLSRRRSKRGVTTRGALLDRPNRDAQDDTPWAKLRNPTPYQEQE